MTETTPLTRPEGEQSSMSIPDRFRQVVLSQGHRVAVSSPGDQWTYAELDERSTALACVILDHLGQGEGVVALLFEHGAPLVAAILGVLKAGRIYLALDADDVASSTRAMLADAQARLLLTDPPHAVLARSLSGDSLQALVVSSDGATHPACSACADVAPDAGAWLMYTSGSTGSPKGVWQSHRAVVHHADVYRDLVQITQEDRLLLLTSCGLAASATPLFTALLHGATLCPFHFRSQGAKRLAQWVRQQRVTVYQSVPTVFRRLVAVADRSSLDSLRLVRLGGETVRRSDIDAFRRHCPPEGVLMNALSSTETGLMTAFLIDRHRPLPEGPISVGFPVRGVAVRLVDERRMPVDAGSEGLIMVSSMYLAEGYWRRPEATAQAFQPDPQNPLGRRFLTADLGRFRADGCLEHMGRAGRQVKIRGRRVDLEEVEAALLETGLVDEAAVLPREEPSGEPRLIAYVVPREGTRPTSRTYRRALSGQLSGHMIPDGFVRLSDLPSTRGGKVDRLALPAPPGGGASRRGHGPLPRDRLEKRLAAIWESVLGISPIGRREDFFDLGGTSLQSIDILTRIEDQFNLVLSPSVLLEHSTIGSLTEWIAHRAVISSPRSLIALRSSPTGRPLFLLHTGDGYVAKYGQLARRLSDRPVYALQARGLRAECWPLMSVPAMARCYVEEIKTIDPTGPYLLAGACMGGLIAFEMAVQLVRQGRPVGLVALLDSEYPAPKGRQLRPTERLASPVRDAFRILRWSTVRAIGLGRSPRWLPTYRSFVQHMHARARRAYRPGSYPGTLTLFLAQRQYEGKDLRLMMACCARNTRTIQIPSDPADLLVPPAVEEVARQLQSCLRFEERGETP